MDAFIKAHRDDEDLPVDLSTRTCEDLDAYFAGFVAADGCATFKGRCPIINVKQKKRAVLDAFAAHFGVGTVSTDGAKHFQYAVSGKEKAGFVAKRIVPYMHECGKKDILVAFDAVDKTTDVEHLRKLSTSNHGCRAGARVRKATMNGHVNKVVRGGIHKGYQAFFGDANKTFASSKLSMEEKLAMVEEWLEERRMEVAEAGGGRDVDPSRIEAAGDAAERAAQRRAELEESGRAEREATIAEAARKKEEELEKKKAAKAAAPIKGRITKVKARGDHVGYQAFFGKTSKVFSVKTETIEDKRAMAEVWLTCQGMIDMVEKSS